MKWPPDKVNKVNRKETGGQGVKGEDPNQRQMSQYINVLKIASNISRRPPITAGLGTEGGDSQPPKEIDEQERVPKVPGPGTDKDCQPETQTGDDHDETAEPYSKF